ncbi:MAG TPA: NAD(P)/FAD-dependent oxidoreductase, partial [Nitrospira sp.]
GSLLWTHFGISGPVVMDVSRFWTLAKQRGETVELLGNFFPELSQEGVGVWFKEQAARFPRRTILHTLTQRLPERFAEAMCGYARCNPMVAIGQCPRPDRNRLLGHLTRFCFSVERERGWNYAEVTRGGIPLDELDYRTMESRIVPGLYFVGEILDCDGRIGGFNFQWAWATGYLAGRAIATRGRCGAAPGDRWNLCKEPHYNDKG